MYSQPLNILFDFTYVCRHNLDTFYILYDNITQVSNELQEKIKIKIQYWIN